MKYFIVSSVAICSYFIVSMADMIGGERGRFVREGGNRIMSSLDMWLRGHG